MQKSLSSRTICLLMGAGILMAQDLTPRELFFAAPAIKAKAAPVVKKGPQPNTKAIDVATSQQPTVNPNEQRLGERPENTDIGAITIPATFVGTATPPLGLRYSLLLSRDNGPYSEVDSTMGFKSGDRLKLTVEANDEAYLYIIARGSSGMWKPLFPVSEVANGDNFVQPFKRYEIPNGGRFYFDEQAGEEKLFIVLTRAPLPSFEDLIYSVNKPKPPAPQALPVGGAPGPPPMAPAPRRPVKTLQVAGLIRPIDDALVGKVRSELVARDLVFEKVDDTKPGPAAQKEKAVYVVDKNGGPNSRLVVDLKLEHK